MILQKINLSSKKIIPLKDDNLVFFKKISVYLFFLWLLFLNVSPLAKFIDDIYFYVSCIIILPPIFFISQKIYKEKNIRSYDKYLLAFLSISVISCLVNFSGFPGNIKRIVWTLIYILFIFSDDDLHNVIKNIKRIFLVFTFIVSLSSLIMFFAQYKSESIVNNLPLRIGFIENRLFGAYIDPNYSSITSIVCSYLCLGEILKKKKNAFFTLNLIVQMLYISLANSRTGQVSLAFSFCLASFLFFQRKIQNKWKIIFSIFLSLCCTVVLLMILNFSSSLMVKIVNTLNCQNNDFVKVTMIRPDVASKADYSNGRIAIWMDALQIFKKHWILGVSPGNITRYAEKDIPNGIIATKHYFAMHNSIMDTLISTGVFGLFSVSIFLLRFVISVIKWYTKKIFDFEMDILTSSIFCILLSSLFVSEIVFFGKVGTFLFWLFLGEIRRKIKKENYEICM